eukprot:881515-Pleurochrysis_carterae.AAC.1
MGGSKWREEFGGKGRGRSWCAGKLCEKRARASNISKSREEPRAICACVRVTSHQSQVTKP